ncbi:bcl-2 homologous antagonist/killer-like [Dreissena polymorpha]|uniref:Bcl-2 Bcl-2 homology region 1-3 domain-containing protein n=1 Tax=Dreissena polymorpha TaxID=45954 RepID=A0A9D4D5B1_DREPO|nr:bcl-2 homologous antagonist/killer-like [Dreissena polymorpha]XP_052241762.1 bcl-2 homologous antagonist/killer-like [Dreissena polymorpha]XP_052241763.1 bcl-2 homologous antagonist/killer-like [Dreissena polymorpha]KAH3738290.1 hypothetical protein DPMN_044923 [Dreissena polymorpha]
MEGTGDYPYNNQVRRNTEEHVLSQTHDVFVSCVQERIRIDVERDESRLTPSTPRGTFQELTRTVHYRDRSAADIGRRLAEMGDKIFQEHSKEFKDMKRELESKKTSTYDSFKLIAQRIFVDKEVHWGRISALFSFGYYLFKDVIWHVASNIAQVVTDIASSIARVFKDSVHGIAQWIVRQGGWSSAISVSGPSNRPVVFWGIIGAAAVTIGAVVWLKSGK